MKIDRPLVDHLAKLVRLELTDAEKSSLEGELTEIVGLMETLASIDVSGVPETASVLPSQNVFRPDVVRPSMDREKVLANAPEQVDDCFAVPRVIG